MKTITVTRLRSAVAETVSEVQFRGERVVLERHGKAVAAVVSIEDLDLLEELEDRILAEAADRAEAASEGKPRISWEQIKQELDL